MLNDILFRLSPGVASVIRWMLHMLFLWCVTERRYAQPEHVGYRGWVELPYRSGVVAIRNLDGTLQYQWR